jgi:divalent metal cation (Fe/Co/Zn/Cd) transporter
MDESVSSQVVDRIRQVVQEQPGVENVEFVRVRATGNGYWLDLGIGLSPSLPAARAQELAVEVRQAVLARSRQLTAVEVYVAPNLASRDDQPREGGAIP